MEPVAIPRLRYAEVSDAAAVADYHVRCWQTSYRGLIDDALIDAMTVEETTQRWTNFFSTDSTSGGAHHVVAVVDDRPVGHLTVAPSREASGSHSVERNQRAGEVLVLYVDPDHQSTGVGSLLLTTGVRMLRQQGFQHGVLWTVAGNDPAIGFYQRHGWALDGEERTQPWGDSAQTIHEVRMSIDLDPINATPGAAEPHILANREHWNEEAAAYVAYGEASWASAPRWGVFGIPDADVALLPDVSGLDVVELGCGTAYVSAWCLRADARSAVGIDNSPAQLATARRLQHEHDLTFPLIWGDAEQLPFADASFDVAISEYGAAIWCDPYRWIPEAARTLRASGTLVFLGNSTLFTLAVNDFENEMISPRLQRAQRGLHHVRWPDTDSSEFHISHGDMIRILRRSGLEVLDLIELYADPDATTSYPFLDAAWASQWPHEEVWIARKT
jgi:SAM-dependent methyltransferase/GNAT superfamily N-acetyltransferase